MTESPMTVREADAADLDRMETLLEGNDLPSRDVRSNPESFYVGEVDGTFVGIGGVERYGSAGLLRSVVVEESRRGQGYGSALCDALEDEASADGVDTLFLLTTTAATFFRARGYEAIDREDAAPAVRRSAQFTDLCPASATCMRKGLR